MASASSEAAAEWADAGAEARARAILVAIVLGGEAVLYRPPENSGRRSAPYTYRYRYRVGCAQTGPRRTPPSRLGAGALRPWADAIMSRHARRTPPYDSMRIDASHLAIVMCTMLRGMRSSSAPVTRQSCTMSTRRYSSALIAGSARTPVHPTTPRLASGACQCGGSARSSVQPTIARRTSHGGHGGHGGGSNPVHSLSSGCSTPSGTDHAPSVASAPRSSSSFTVPWAFRLAAAAAAARQQQQLGS